MVIQPRSQLTKLDFDEVTGWILVTNACVHIHNWPINQEYPTNELRSDDKYLEMNKDFPSQHQKNWT